MKNEIKKHVDYAEATHRKDKRVNIRISKKDLDSLQRKALEEGILYQIFISSILHKFITLYTEKIFIFVPIVLFALPVNLFLPLLSIQTRRSYHGLEVVLYR